MVSNRFAVIGNPIAHSLSPVIHQYFAEQTHLQLTYEKIKADEQNFDQLIFDFFTQGGKGLNITLPFKQRAFSLAEIKSPRCTIAGAANTLFMKNNQLCADNTDGTGLIRDLERYVHVQGKKILILGAGGAVRGIVNPLLEAKPESIVIANRTIEKAIELQAVFPEVKCSGLDLIGEYDLVINATSASLDGQSIVLPTETLVKKPFCYDLAYKQNEDTAFVAYAKRMRCDAVDGLGMLVEQAAEAFFIWHGVMPLTQPVLERLR